MGQGDSWLPDVRDHFAADALAPRFVTGHHALRRGEDRGAHAALDLGDLRVADVRAAAGRGYALHAADHRLASLGVLQPHAQHLTDPTGLGAEVLDVALLLQDARELGLELRSGHVHELVIGAQAVANAREEVRYRVCHRHVATSSTSSFRGRNPGGPSRAGRSGRGRTCGSRRAGGRTACSDCSCGSCTSRYAAGAPPVRSWPSLSLLVRAGVVRRRRGFVAFRLGRISRLRVRLGVFFLQLLQRGLLGLGLRLLLLLRADLGGGRAGARVVAAERHAERGEQRKRLLVGRRRRGDADVEPAHLVDRVVVDLGEDDLLADAHVVVAAPVEALRVEAAEVADPRDRDRREAVEELPHAGVAQRDGDADRHLLAQLEVRDRLARAADARALARDRLELLGGGLQHVGVLLRVAHTHVERDLHEPRRLHPAAVAELLEELRGDLLLVALLQARDDLGLGDRHQSISSPERFAMRLRWPPSRVIFTRVGSFVFGSSSITFEMWIGPGWCVTPPTSPARWASRIERGRWCRVVMLSPSTKTRFFFGSTVSTVPVLPLSLPDMTFTWSPLRIL